MYQGDYLGRFTRLIRANVGTMMPQHRRQSPRQKQTLRKFRDRTTSLGRRPGGFSVSLSTVSVEPDIRPTGWSARELALFSRAAKLLSSGGPRI
jgi:hypothetical protein